MLQKRNIFLQYTNIMKSIQNDKYILIIKITKINILISKSNIMRWGGG